MTSDFDVIAYLRAQLREDPSNQGFKNLIKGARRRNKAQGCRKRPPPRTAKEVERRLLFDIPVPLSPEQGHVDSLPIDMEISRLVEDGHISVISPDAQAAGEDGMTWAEAIWEGRTCVVWGCSWGDYYANFRLGREPAARACAKIGLEDARIALNSLEKFISTHAVDIEKGNYNPDNIGAANPQDNLASEVGVLRNTRDALVHIVDRLTLAKVDRGGDPGDPWSAGFVFGVSEAWVRLTPLKISGKERARFVEFVASAAASLGDKKTTERSWPSAIKAAIKSFGLSDDRRSWVRGPDPRTCGSKPAS